MCKKWQRGRGMKQSQADKITLKRARESIILGQEL